MDGLRWTEYAARKRFGLKQDEPINKDGITHLIHCEHEFLKQSVSKRARAEAQMDIEALMCLLEIAYKAK